MTYLKYKSDLLEAGFYWLTMLFQCMTNINRKTHPKNDWNGLFSKVMSNITEVGSQSLGSFCPYFFMRLEMCKWATALHRLKPWANPQPWAMFKHKQDKREAKFGTFYKFNNKYAELVYVLFKENSCHLQFKRE